MPAASCSGPRRSGGQDPAGVSANGRNGNPLGGLRFPAGQNHHHGRRQEGQRPLPHHTRHRWAAERGERAHIYVIQRFNGHVSATSGNFGDRYFGTDAPPDWSDEEVEEPSYWWHSQMGTIVQRALTVARFRVCSPLKTISDVCFRSEKAAERTKVIVTLWRVSIV